MSSVEWFIQWPRVLFTSLFNIWKNCKSLKRVLIGEKTNSNCTAFTLEFSTPSTELFNKQVKLICDCKIVQNSYPLRAHVTPILYFFSTLVPVIYSMGVRSIFSCYNEIHSRKPLVDTVWIVYTSSLNMVVNSSICIILRCG